MQGIGQISEAFTVTEYGKPSENLAVLHISAACELLAVTAVQSQF